MDNSNKWAKLINEERTLLKRHALENEHPKLYNSLYYNMNKHYQDGNYKQGDFFLSMMSSISRSIAPNYTQVVDSLIRSRQRKAKNIKEKITYQLEQGQAYFITLTFTDEVLSSTNETTRRKYVARALKSCATHYLANIDYGQETAREHYHAVINANITPYIWPYGFVKSIRIAKDDSAPIKIGKYISKLTNHALKDYANGKSRFRTIIYSRNV